MGLLEKMQYSIDSMTLGEKFAGSIVVTLMGVGIVFAALATLFIAIIVMQKIVNAMQPKKEVVSKPTIVEQPVEEEDHSIDDTELVAVITAAVAASLHTSTHNIIVRNITRVGDSAPSWARVGRMDQVSNKL